MRIHDDVMMIHDDVMMIHGDVRSFLLQIIMEYLDVGSLRDIIEVADRPLDSEQEVE